MTALWILGAVLAVLLLISLVRVGGALEYNKGGLCVWAKVGRLSVQIYPARPKKVE